MDEIIVNETPIFDTDVVEMKFASYGVSFSIIKNEHLRNAVLRYFVDIVPKYFWHVQASSTGKYHPEYALMLHDTFKHGEESLWGRYSQYSMHEHPLIAAEKVRERLDDEHKCAIANCIASHMGEWTESNRSHYVLPKPKTPEEQMVHLCDYLASRKFLEFKF